MTSLNGKTALITGGSKGIGAAVSLLLAKDGANIAINYSTDTSAAQSIVNQIGATKVIAIKGDAGSMVDVEDMVQQTVKRFRKIDILIPCAGVLPIKDLEATTEDDFDAVMQLNVKGPYFLVQKAVPHMPAGSHIILVSTTLTIASHVQPNMLLYNTSKGAIEQMTRVLAKDLAKKGIVVNAVAPGPTSTDSLLKGRSEELLKTFAGLSPFQRLGTPEEVAKAFLFLAGAGSQWVSGQVVRVNGAIA